jgi:oligo-1,6-glucosidase
MMRWWLHRGADGFGMDVINLISKVGELPDGAPIDGGPLGDGTPFVMCGPRIHDSSTKCTNKFSPAAATDC